MQPVATRKSIRQKLLMCDTPYHDHNYFELDDHFEEESIACDSIATPTERTAPSAATGITGNRSTGVSVFFVFIFFCYCAIAALSDTVKCWSGGSTSTLSELLSAINTLTALFNMTTCNSFDIDAKRSK